MPDFEAWIKYQQDYPNLNCRKCEELFDQGDLAELPCEICPERVMEVPDDRVSQLTFRFLEYATGGLIREQTPPWPLILAAAGIHDLETFAEVWVRAGMVRHIAEEYEERKRQQQQRK